MSAGGRPQLEIYLRDRDVSFELIEHVHSESAVGEARAAHIPAEQTAKTVVLHAPGGYRFAVISASDRPRFVRCRRAQAFDRLMRTHPQVRGYADCIGHTLAAEGKIGAAVDYGLRLWDIAASQVLIEEAGGRYACVYRSHDADGDLFGIIAGKPSLVRWLEGIFG